MNTQNIRYETDRAIAECIREIMDTPHKYMCASGTPLWYKVELIESTKLAITFCGGQFRKSMHTQYLAEFMTVGYRTTVTLHFHSELFGLPPMTPISDIDLFMSQKIDAVRCITDDESIMDTPVKPNHYDFYHIWRKCFRLLFVFFIVLFVLFMLMLTTK